MEPVFVDHTGRRRRLFTSLGAGLGVLLIIGCMLLIAGLLGSSPVPLPGLPEGGQGGLHRDDAGVNPGPSRTATPGASSGRQASPTATTTQAATAPASPSADPPGNRRTSHPVNPKPSRTK